MQDKVIQNDFMCDEAHDVENDDEEFENEGWDSDNAEGGLPILIHIERFEGGPVASSLVQKELIGEIVNGCVQDYPISVDTLNEFECVIVMPKKLTASLVAQEIQHMTHWGGIRANIQCTIASRTKLKNIVESRERERKKEAEDSSVQKVSESTPIESMMKNMMNSILATVDEKLKSVSGSSLPNVSNQSFATDRVIPAVGNVTELDDQNPLKRGGAQLVHRTPRLSFFSGEDPPGKSEKTYEQWIFDVKTVRPSYPEGLLKEAIFSSLKGNAADIAWGLGPETTVDKVLELLEGVFGRKTNPDILMQDFYKITQESKEKVSTFGIRLKVALDRIMGFHPECLTQVEAEKKLKDRFYYGVRQNVREGLRYYYEVLGADYTTLLIKARSIEAEKSVNTSTIPVTLKSAVPVDQTNQNSNLEKQIGELVAIVKNQQVQSSKGQGKKKSNGHSAWEKAKDNEKGGRNLRGPDTNSSGPFRNGSPPWQCYNCSGWGHRAFECSSPLNYRRGEASEKKKLTSNPPDKATNANQDKPDINKKTNHN